MTATTDHTFGGAARDWRELADDVRAEAKNEPPLSLDEAREYLAAHLLTATDLRKMAEDLVIIAGKLRLHREALNPQGQALLALLAADADCNHAALTIRDALSRGTLR